MHVLPKKVFPFLFYFIRQQWIKFLIMVLASAAWGMNNALLPYFLKRLINSLASSETGIQKTSHSTTIWIVSIILLFVGVNLLLRVQGFVLIRFCSTFRASIREALFQHVQRHSFAYFATHFSGTIASKIAEVPMACERVLFNLSFEFLVAFIGITIAILTMGIPHPIFAGVLTLWLLAYFTILFLFLRKGHFLLQDHANAVTTLSGKIVDVLTNIQNVKLFAREKYEESYFHHFQKEELTQSRKAHGHLEWMLVCFSLNELFLILSMLFLLLRGWQQHWVTLGDFTQIMMQSFWLSGWMWFVSYQVKFFLKDRASIRAVLSLIQEPHEITDVPNALTMSVSRGEITFEKVTFSYPGNLPLFHNLNVTIRSGEKVGLVGLSGTGKTTFMNLLLRLYDLDSGTILIDDLSIAAVTQESLHHHIAVIPQECSLFHRTLMENIRYGRLEATDEEVLEASRKAHCHEFIEQLPEGYQSLVGERGIKLSGGQRQRVAIARAFLKNAPVLILDEATSSLDSTTEQHIQESLLHLMKNRTTIVIAHRLSTLAVMDRILVFHKGSIVEEGTIPELLKKEGHFSELWKKQTERMI